MHRFRTWQLLAGCVLIWSTTWFAITFQVGRVAPEAGVALRFGLAGCVVLAICAIRRQPLRFGLRDHGLLLLQGGFMYGVSYVCVYHAERHVVSGLVAVGYSASPLVAGLGARILFGTPITSRFVLGGVLGVAGVALIFWPEFGRGVAADAVGAPILDAGRASADSSSLAPTYTANTELGAALTILSVVLSAIGSLTASRNRANGLPFWPALGFGMLYGAAVAAVIALCTGVSFAPPAAVSWWLSLLYLSLAGSVVAFACFLTLQERIGPGPSSTVGVMTPLLALVVSMVFEAFEPEASTFVGAALALLGNVLMLDLLPARKVATGAL